MHHVGRGIGFLPYHAVEYRVSRLLATALHWAEYSSSENYSTVSYDTDFQKEDAHIIQGIHS